MSARIRERWRKLGIGLALACLLVGTAYAEERPQDEPSAEEPVAEDSPSPVSPAAAGEFRRDVIALYSVNKPVPNQDVYNPIAQMVEMPLNHLGLRVHTFDVAAGPPPKALTTRARAVVTWFDKPDGLPAWVIPWLETYQAKGEGKLVFLETLPGLGGTKEEQAWLREWIGRLDLTWPDVFVSGAARVEVTFHKGEACALEANPKSRAKHYGPASNTVGHDLWVSTRDRLDPEKGCTPVLTAPWGGMALGPFLMRMGEGLGDRRWYLDPFQFLGDALDMPAWPVPHPSVLFGRRMFTFHVDGDGFESLSEVEPGSNCGVVLRDAVINKYLIPSTISIIVASLTPDLHIKKPTAKMKTARSIFEADWVEATSHGVLHPFNWDKPWGPSPAERANFGFPGLRGFTYSPAAEVGESLRFIDTRLLPKGKFVVGMLWTGESIAPASAIRAAEEMDCWNLNGGTFRWDAAHDSVGYVSPWGRTVDGYFQVYAGAANENEFDGFYDRSPGAFGHISTTIERTGRGRILKPASVYAHFYSAERHLRLKALQKLIERWAFEEPTIPVFASAYALAVQGAMKARVQVIDGGWRLEDWGACHTARFDGEARGVDFERSTNVWGANRIDGNLYVMTGPGRSEVFLAKDPAPRPHIKESNHPLADVVLSAKGVRLVSKSFTPRKIILAGLPAEAGVELLVGESVREVETDKAGRLLITLEAAAPAHVEVRVP